ncbi:MAG: DUF1800 domain-containing protein, partial [Hydrococcus sp. SU_1_0]|nr:DUF1800 domain-containing protein [Hydrococcus sp. SU_1_0]
MNQVKASDSLVTQGHILSRLSFGATSSVIEEVNQAGIEAYIQSQLRPQSIKESPVLAKYLAKLGSINREPVELYADALAFREQLENSKLSTKQQDAIQQDLRKLSVKTINEAADARLARGIYANRQLQEVMVDFWINHFNVHVQKSGVKFWLHDYENQIRSHSLGNFDDLLMATAKHPAMLMYLDNKNNTAPESPWGKKNNQGLNENYARELMELHTLGVDGGYSQDDVITLARILTGWSL